LVEDFGALFVGDAIGGSGREELCDLLLIVVDALLLLGGDSKREAIDFWLMEARPTSHSSLASIASIETSRTSEASSGRCRRCRCGGRSRG
jgi:hypothetical protein